MKISVGQFMLITLFCHLSFANVIIGQKAKSIFEVDLPLSVNNQSAIQVFSRIEEGTDFKFAFDKKMLEKKSNISFTEPTLGLALTQISKQLKLNFRQVNNLIAVSEASVEQTDPIEVVITDEGISGKVLDGETKEPLVGATVLVKGTTEGTITDIEGQFSLQTDKKAILVVTFVGYETTEIDLGNKSFIEVSLQPDYSNLDEVVVVGYGTQKKSNLTGSLSSIKSEELDDRPITQASQALAGLVPGVYLNTNTGEAGNDQSNILIRGIGTLNNANPLILVDGIEAPINNLNPNDIESIEVLKDAASASIYGSRAANGVILVTTKKGAYSTEPVIEYKIYSGVSNPTVLPDMVTDPRTYMELYREAIENGGGTVAFTEADIERYEKIGPTDWSSVIFNKNASIVSNSIAVRGGSENLAYSISLGALNQEGLIKGNNFDRYNGRLNLTSRVGRKLNIGTNISVAVENGKLAAKEAGAFGGLDINELNGKGSLAFESALVQHPIVPVYTPLGEYATLENALAIQRDRNNGQAILDNERLNLRGTDVLSSSFAEYEILKDWKVKGTLGLNYQFNDLLDTRAPFNIVDPVTESIIRSWNTFFGNGSLTQQTKELLNVTYWLQTNYTKSIGQHNFHLLAGYNQETSDQRTTTIRQADFGSSDLITLGNGATTTDALRNQGKWGLRSFFARINYDFNDRYLFEFNIRRDGSSRFGKNNRWATFPSLSAGWVLSNESFWSQGSFISSLKLRGSWGLLGNQNTDFYPFTSAVNLNQNYSINGNLVSGAALVRLGNEDLKWEESEMIDIGMNADLFDFKLSIEADYFFKETRDILTPINNPLISGVAQPTIVNAGIVENEGWESTIGYRDRIGELKIGLSFNVTHVKNKVTAINPDLAGEDDLVELDFDDNVWLIRGEAINAIYGYEVASIFQSQSEISAAPDHSFFGTPEPGDFRFTDQNGDGVINAKDRTVIGNRQPRWLYGANMNLDFKGFDFSVLFQGIGKAETYLSRYVGPFPFAGLRSVWQERWTPENPSQTMPRLWIDRSGYNGQTVESKASSFWVEDRAFLRLKNIQLGYTLPKKLFGTNFISNLRVFVNAQNLWTITDFANGDFDPERIDTQRHATAALPQFKTITGGFNLKF